jgi:hypothetical protein
MKPLLSAVWFSCLVAVAAGGALAGEPSASDIEAACIAKLAETANRPASDIKVVGTAADGDGQLVTLDLDGAESAWLCHVDAAGSVIDVMYDGEG